jgi:hypothetical protein
MIDSDVFGDVDKSKITLRFKPTTSTPSPQTPNGIESKYSKRLKPL